MDLRERYAAEMPGHFFLDADVEALRTYLTEQGVLRGKGLLRRGEAVKLVEVLAGGNMNCVQRVTFAAPGRQPSVAVRRGSAIVKQARPWVERYPAIAAPVARARAEAKYFQLVGLVPELAQRSPTLYHHDGGNHVLVLEDLGRGADLSSLYAGGDIRERLADGRTVLQTLVTYLVKLHAHFRENPPARPLANKAMRQLNHEHVFALPFRESNGLELDAFHPGLAALARGVTDDVLRKRTRELGERYLDLRAGGTLLHGDFHFGSALIDRAGAGGAALYVIDPEFAFTGPPEWDFGVLAAHLYLSGAEEAIVAEARGLYDGPLDEALWRGFAGTEILRRLLGVAQLPLGQTADRATLLRTGRALVVEHA